MARYRKYLIGCIYRFQFRDRLGSPQPSPSLAASVHQENGLFFPGKLLIISYSPHTDVEIHS